MIQELTVTPGYAIETDEGWTGDLPMRCPVEGCGFDYTHLLSVTCYERPGGEDKQTVAFTINGQGLASAGPVDGNPSGRRDATVLHFTCESGHLFDVQFVQHKGQTFVDIANARDDPDVLISGTKVKRI